MSYIRTLKLDKIQDRTPIHYEIDGLDFVIVKYDENVSVLYGRCLHRGALMADGYIEGNNLICGLHGWDYRLDTGVSEYNNKETLYKFKAETKDGFVWIDEDEIKEFLIKHPQPFNRKEYQGQYADTHPEDTEPYTLYIKELAKVFFSY